MSILIREQFLNHLQPWAFTLVSQIYSSIWNLQFILITGHLRDTMIFCLMHVRLIKFAQCKIANRTSSPKVWHFIAYLILTKPNQLPNLTLRGRFSLPSSKKSDIFLIRFIISLLNLKLLFPINKQFSIDSFLDCEGHHRIFRATHSSIYCTQFPPSPDPFYML